MKKLIASIIVVLLGTSLFAQEWASIGSKWHYSLQSETSTGYILIESIRDTMVQEHDCRILSQTGYGWTFPGYLDTVKMGDVITYENEGVVYYLVDDEFYELFNINGAPGYSWTVKAPFKDGHQISDTTGIVTIDSTGVEIIDDQSYKVIFISTQVGCVGFGSTKIIEGIGPIGTYLFPQFEACIIDASIGGPLRCFQNSTFDYTTGNSSSCDLILTNSRDHKIDPVNVYPNPFTDHFFIDNSQNTQMFVEVYSITGILLDQITIDQRCTETITLLDDSFNLYVLAIKTEDFVYNQLIMKK